MSYRGRGLTCFSVLSIVSVTLGSKGYAWRRSNFSRRSLESWDFEVIAVEDGEAALKILESDEAPELAILDWIMPKIDGVEVCAAIRQRAPHPYIYMILLTALTKKHDITSGLAPDIRH